ncbi:MAG: NnrS family protein [Reyranella sp.]|nr:NnrS family protein [Reyranella sp.]
MVPIPRLKSYVGPALLSYGFRPFFLLGSTWAGIEVLAWLPMFYGELTVATVFSPRDWHVHELLFGYVPAIVAGFLLTAIPNWTGRLPLQGRSLGGLVLVWLAGRFAVTLSADIGWVGAAAVDCTFLVLMAAAVAREIIVGKNWGNLKIVALLSLLTASNLAFHIEARFEGIALYSTRLGIAVILIMIMVVGGRIIPSFTRNWLMRRAPGRLPVPFGRFDVACVVLSSASLLLWIVKPEGELAGMALIAACALNIARLCRWAGNRTLSDRLVLVLHVGYAFVPLGFLLSGLAAFGTAAPSAGIHAWTAGAIGIMTLAVMSRASLGHTGRALIASPALQAVYAAALTAALARISAVLHPEWGGALLHLAAFAWTAAFLGFAYLYAPILCLTRPTKVRGPS